MMIIYKIIVIFLIIKTNHAEFMQIFRPFNPAALPRLPNCPPPPQPQIVPNIKPSMINLTTADIEKPNENMKFLLPFMDIELQYDRNIHVMQEVVQQQIYILHGHELYQLFVSRQEKRLSLMGYLEGSVRQREPLGAEIIFWQGNLLLVIALDEHLEVYQLSKEVLQIRADIVKNPRRAHEPAPTFEAIQQLTLTGKYQKLFLFSPTEERIMIVAAVNFTKLYGKFRTFEWIKTYFDPIEDITVPSIHVVNVVGTHDKYLITGRTIKHQTKTILTVYEITQPSLQMHVKQTLTVQSRVVHIFNYRNRNIIVACSSKQRKCNSFRQMPDGNFNVYKQRTPKELAFDLLSSSSRFIIASRQNQIMIFTNYRLDCYGSFISDQMEVTKLMGHRNKAKEDYVMLIYKRPFKVLIRVIEMELNLKDDTGGLGGGNFTEPEDMLASTRHQHLFESTIGQLRSLLLQRKMDMDVLRKVATLIRPKMKELKVKEPITLQAGNVRTIRVVGESLRSPKQILEKVTNLRQLYLPQQRPKRSQIPESFNVTLEITNRIKVNKIKVKNLIYPGEIIQGFFLNQSAKPLPILFIKPKVKTHTFNTTELILPQNKRAIRQFIPDLYFDLMPSLRINHLKVDTINGKSWQEFYETIFLKNRDTTIQGRLVLQSQVDVDHLRTPTLNGLIVTNLFNLRDPQAVHSDLVISRFFVNDLKAEIVNDLNFEEDIVYSGQDSHVETPVIMHHLHISGDLLLADNNKFERVTIDPDDMEFKQIYTNKVIINGSLIVNNIKRENNKTKIIIGKMEFKEHEIKEKYLLKQEAQNFTFPIIFDNAKVWAPNLETEYLNDHLTEQYMRVNYVNSSKPLLVVFMNAQIKGDLICRDYKSKIAEIKENLIKPGDIAEITGSKIFEGPLAVDTLKVETFNQLPATDLVFKTHLENIKFKDLKIFEKIKVKNPSNVDKELQASYLNNLPLEDLLNYDYYMDRLSVKHILETSNIVFHKINGIPFDEFFRKVNIQYNQLVLHKDLIVEGNVLFVEPLELKQINDVNWNEYVANLVRINENVELEGNVSFQGDLTITKNLETKEINNFDLKEIFENILMKTKPQLITGLYTFENLNVSNLDVLSINNRKIQEFIDLSKNLTELKGDVIVENLSVKGELKGILNKFLDLNILRENLKSLLTKPWKNLVVLHNATWPMGLNDNFQQELLKYFHKNSVKSNQDQIITGNVRISKPLITKMQTRLQFPPEIDIDFISKDGLFKNSSVLQIIKNRKEFLKPLYMEKLQVRNVLKTHLLNNIDILRFNDSLYRLTSNTPLLGPLKFLKPLTVRHLRVEGLINGLNSSVIYQLDKSSKIPALKVYDLFIDNNVEIKNINHMSLEYFLENRVTLQGPALEQFGSLTFENLVIKKEALMQNINNIHIDNLVFKHSPYLQTISGHKTIEKSLELAGPAHIMRINDKDLMELYRNSLVSDQNYQFENLQIEKATFERGLQVVRNLDANFKQRSFTDLEKSAQEKREEFKDFLLNVKEKLQSTKQEILYLDYDFNSQIKWGNPQNSHANQTILYEISRLSCCEKQYLNISFDPHLKDIYLQNITTNRLSVFSNKISIKAENYCKLKYRKVKSKITIAHQKLLKVFGMKRYIENIFTLTHKQTQPNYVLLHALDLPSLKRNELRIFKIDNGNNSIEDWQGLTQNVGEVLKLYESPTLISILTNGMVDNHPALTIYHLNATTNLFKLQQIIDGDYDLIEMVDLASPTSAQQKQMIISCRKCHRIFIYDYSPKTLPNYEIFQIITLKSSIDKLAMFSFASNHYMLVISHSDSGFYNIYKYSYIQGWVHLTYGYFPNLQMSVPLSQLWSKDNNLVISQNSNGIPLLLLCNLDNCYLVKAIV